MSVSISCTTELHTETLPSGGAESHDGVKTFNVENIDSSSPALIFSAKELLGPEFIVVDLDAKRFRNAQRAIDRVSIHFVLPDPKHGPTLLAQFTRTLLVALPVAVAFFCPISGVALRCPAIGAVRARVPETAVDENGNFLFSKNNVWPAR
jgi:hypothetical protein